MSLVQNGEISGTIAVNGTITGVMTVSKKLNIEENVNVTPSATQQVITPGEGYDAMAQVTVAPVALEDLSITPSNEQQVFTAGENYNGLGTVTVGAVSLQNKTVTPSSVQQTINADNGYNGLGTVTVEAASTLYDFVLSSDMQSQIPSYMFRDQVNMRSFKTSKNNVYSMGSQVFDGCTNLKRVEMPYLTGIGNDAFYGCDSIEDYYFGYKSQGLPADASLVPTLPRSNTLRGNNFTIHVPSDMETYYKEATYWSSYASRIVGDYDPTAA